MLLPALFEMRLQLGREAGVVENEPRARALRLQFKPAIEYTPLRPVRGTPCLYDAAVGRQFNVPPLDVAAEERERPPSLALDLRRSAGDRRKLLRIEQGFVDALGGPLRSISKWMNTGCAVAQTIVIRALVNKLTIWFNIVLEPRTMSSDAQPWAESQAACPTSICSSLSSAAAVPSEMIGTER